MLGNMEVLAGWNTLNEAKWSIIKPVIGGPSPKAIKFRTKNKMAVASGEPRSLRKNEVTMVIRTTTPIASK